VSAPDRRLLAAGAVLTSGALFFLGVGQAIEPIGVATWLAPLPAFAVASRLSGRGAAVAAFLAYLLGTTNSWVFFTRSYDVPLVVGIPVSLFLSLAFAAAVWVFRRLLVRDRPITAVVAGPATWASCLHLVPFLEPYGLVGTLAEQLTGPLALQVATVTGGLGVDVLVLLAAAAVATARPRALVAGAVVLAAALGLGAARLGSDTVAEPHERVAVVVSNPTGWGPDVASPAGQALLDGYLAEIAALPEGVRLAVLPEGALTVQDAELSRATAAFAQVARERGTAVVVGLAHPSGGQRYAQALVVAADGSVAPLYLKHHDRVSPPGRDLAFVPGTPTPTGVLICADVNYPDPADDYGRAGAGLVAAPASDNGANGWLHARTAVLRGVENGYAVAWAGQQGHALIADRYGRVLAEADLGGPGPFTTIVADVPVAPGPTVAARLGGAFGWLCLAVVVAALTGTVRARRLSHT
jgi:apolipoprotein N-acyltransferase